MSTLQIRQEQLERLQVNCQAGFLRRLQSSLVENHPDLIEVVPLVKREPLLSELWNRAKGYGLTTEANVYQFVVASLKHGSGFELTVAFRNINGLLMRTKVNQNLKMMQVNEALRVHEENRQKSRAGNKVNS